MERITRKDFLRISGMSALGLFVLSGCEKAESSPPLPLVPKEDLLKNPQDIRYSAFSEDKKGVVTGHFVLGINDVIYKSELENGSLVDYRRTGHPKLPFYQPKAFNFSKNGEYLAVGSLGLPPTPGYKSGLYLSKNEGPFEKVESADIIKYINTIQNLEDGRMLLHSQVIKQEYNLAILNPQNFEVTAFSGAVNTKRIYEVLFDNEKNRLTIYGSNYNGSFVLTGTTGLTRSIIDLKTNTVLESEEYLDMQDVTGVKIDRDSAGRAERLYASSLKTHKLFVLDFTTKKFRSIGDMLNGMKILGFTKKGRRIWVGGYTELYIKKREGIIASFEDLGSGEIGKTNFFRFDFPVYCSIDGNLRFVNLNNTYGIYAVAKIMGSEAGIGGVFIPTDKDGNPKGDRIYYPNRGLAIKSNIPAIFPKE